MNPWPMLDHVNAATLWSILCYFGVNFRHRWVPVRNASLYTALKIQTTSHWSITCTTGVGPRRVLQERC